MDAFKRIQANIDNNHFSRALSLIKKAKKRTLYIRRLNNLEAVSLIGLNRWEDAKRIMDTSAPYLLLDSDDVYALRILSDIYYHDLLPYYITKLVKLKAFF